MIMMFQTYNQMKHIISKRKQCKSIIQSKHQFAMLSPIYLQMKWLVKRLVYDL